MAFCLADEVEAADYAPSGRALRGPVGLQSALRDLLAESTRQTLAGSTALQEDVNGAHAVVSYLYDKEKKP
jgi:hypothetical protein